MARLTSINFQQMPRRLVADLKPLQIGNLVFLGRLHYLRASTPLSVHLHPGTMEICYLAEGRQTYEVDGKSYRLRGGDVLITPPDVKHSTAGFPEERSTLYWLQISLDSPGGRFMDYAQEESAVLVKSLRNMKVRHFKGDDELQRILERVFAAFFSGDKFRNIRIRALITEFLIRIVELAGSPGGQKLSTEVVSVLALIHENINEHIMLETLAEQACLSLSRFKQRFRQETGTAPREYILREKIKKAEQYIRNSKSSITEIANDLSFSSSQYFATVFKRFTGKKPTDFRKTCKIPKLATDERR